MKTYSMFFSWELRVPIVISSLTVALFFMATAGTAMGQTLIMPTVDASTQGKWFSEDYGLCAYVLSGYYADVGCEMPILDGLNDPSCSEDFATCTNEPPEPWPLSCVAGNYEGGAASEFTDCRELEIVPGNNLSYTVDLCDPPAEGPDVTTDKAQAFLYECTPGSNGTRPVGQEIVSGSIVSSGADAALEDPLVDGVSQCGESRGVGCGSSSIGQIASTWDDASEVNPPANVSPGLCINNIKVTNQANLPVDPDKEYELCGYFVDYDVGGDVDSGPNALLKRIQTVTLFDLSTDPPTQLSESVKLGDSIEGGEEFYNGKYLCWKLGTDAAALANGLRIEVKGVAKTDTNEKLISNINAVMNGLFLHRVDASGTRMGCDEPLPPNPTLKLKKTVINDDGGTAVVDDFQAFVDNEPVDWFIEIELEPGDYTVSESGVDGYLPSDWGGDCDADGSISLALGDEAVCTITNDDQPTGEDCTLTQGYWKTHSEYGPAPYDDTWDAKDGGDAEFFETGFSYYEILITPPKGGNAYIQLAHQWIAAELNQIGGASIPSDVLDAFNQAEGLLIQYENEVSIPKRSADRDLAIDLAGLLDDYNNGLVGPGHCPD